MADVSIVVLMTIFTTALHAQPDYTPTAQVLSNHNASVAKSIPEIARCINNFISNQAGGKMKIYLASRYSRHKELQTYAADLINRDHKITSRWIWGNHQIDDQGLSVEAKRAERERFAREDWDDIIEADICISFTETPRSTNSRGGRHVEFGIALGLAMPCFVIGPRENVFHCLPAVPVFEGWLEFITHFDHIIEGQVI